MTPAMTQGDLRSMLGAQRAPSLRRHIQVPGLEAQHQVHKAGINRYWGSACDGVAARTGSAPTPSSPMRSSQQHLLAECGPVLAIKPPGLHAGCGETD